MLLNQTEINKVKYLGAMLIQAFPHTHHAPSTLLHWICFSGQSLHTLHLPWHYEALKCACTHIHTKQTKKKNPHTLHSLRRNVLSANKWRHIKIDIRIFLLAFYFTVLVCSKDGAILQPLVNIRAMKKKSKMCMSHRDPNNTLTQKLHPYITL